MWLEIFKWLVDAFYDYRKFKTSEDIVKESSVLFDNALDYEKLIKTNLFQDEFMKQFFKDYNTGKYGPTNMKDFKAAQANRETLNDNKEILKQHMTTYLKGTQKVQVEQWVKAIAKLDKNNRYNQYFWDQLDQIEMSDEGFTNFKKELEAFENNQQELGGEYWLTWDKHSDHAINKIIVKSNPDESQYTYDIEMQFYKKGKRKMYQFFQVPFAIIIIMISYTMTEMLPSGYLAGALHFFTYSYWKGEK